MSDFAERLSALASIEMTKARRDPDRMSAMIERLCATLGLTIAVASQGHGDAIDELVAGAEGYIHSEAVDKAPLAREMAGQKP